VVKLDASLLLGQFLAGLALGFTSLQWMNGRRYLTMMLVSGQDLLF
jgi:hypothetical protein